MLAVALDLVWKRMRGSPLPSTAEAQLTPSARG
jgi:hypothetical protein